MDRSTAAVFNNESESRFQTSIDGQVALLQYRLSDGVITFVHTEVPSALEGRGLGGELVRTGLEHARSNDLRVVPQCSFVASYLKSHPEFKDLVVAQ